MNRRELTYFLIIGLVLSFGILLFSDNAFHLPGNQQGYEPEQPIAFSHRLHAGEMGISCFLCHGGSEKSRHAGIPSPTTCMTCHKFITAPKGAIVAEQERAKKAGVKPNRIVSPEIQKIYDALALNEKMERDPGKTPKPIQWVKVHNLPDFVYFDHRPHINAEVDCQKCHGPVETMERMRQSSSLSMGWCLSCHRDAKINGINGRKVNPSTDCSTCHY